ncbi:hypothetical protein MBRA1_000122 [Malassezia brasiliensis]|uniref:Rab-GAP TBC domain-containing protein n=1 Tax=Malassezia brasiliensis TaxID=1821822 RepID=A0AAF0DQF9_9BASI|nr:hypothetical protein MBRA1_000122 [Malassezia brasiliensis]
MATASTAPRPALSAARSPDLAHALYPRAHGIVDLDALRAACTAGELHTHPPWVRTQAYKLLLSYLPPDVSAWATTLHRRRTEYWQFLADLSDEQQTGVYAARSPDRVLDQVYKDLFRAADVDPDFYDAPARWMSDTYAAGARHCLLERLERVNQDFARAAAHDRPPHARFVDRQWHAVLRVLFLYAMLNPSIGYIQGMNEVVYVLLHAFFATRDDDLDIGTNTASDRVVLGVENTADAEADAFWCFSLLIGGLREVYDFGQGDATTAQAMRGLADPLHADAQPPDNGLAAALHRMSAQLAQFDPMLAEVLAEHQLDPRLPYYSLRWLVCLYACEFPWPGVLRLWDVLLAQKHDLRTEHGMTNAQIHFLLDIGCALLVSERDAILSLAHTTPDVFQHAIELLQPRAPHDVSRVLALALDILHQRAQQASLPRTAAGRRQPPIGARNHRNASLQQRLAATVQRTLHAPPARAATWTPGMPSQRAPNTDTPASHASPPSAAHAPVSAPVGSDAAQRTPTEAPSHPALASPSSPSAPSIASSGRALFRRYTEALQDSNAAASMSKVRTNLAAKALAWRSGSSSSASDGGMTPASPPVSAPAAMSDVPQLPIPSVVDSPQDRDAYQVLSHTRVGIPPTPSTPRRVVLSHSPAASEDDSFNSSASGVTHLSLPSMRKAAQMGLLHTPPSSDAPFGVPLNASETSPSHGAGLTRRIPSGQRVMRRRASDRASPNGAAGSVRPAPTSRAPRVRTHDMAPAPAADGAADSPGAHATEHLDALLHELQTTDWIRD